MVEVWIFVKKRLWGTCVVSLTEKGSLLLKLWRVEVDRKAFSAEKSSIWPLKVTPDQKQCYQTKGQTWFPITSQ